jgi:hypothetical protein
MQDAARIFLFDLIVESEDGQKKSPDFLLAATKWMRSWFAPDGDLSAQMIFDLAGNELLKKALIEQKLPGLLQNQQFKTELQNMLAQDSTQKISMKNVIENARVEVQGNAKIGDTGVSSGDAYDQKNILKSSNIQAGGDFRLGDDIIQAGGNIHFGDIHYHQTPPDAKAATPDAAAPLAKELRKLIASARTAEAITLLVRHAEQSAPDLQNEVLAISARWENLKRRERMGILSYSEVNVERNQLNSALLGLIGELEG